ncbi:MAG: repeat domain protein [bacterium]|nr:repeat domain protein [bacterium]
MKIPVRILLPLLSLVLAGCGGIGSDGAEISAALGAPVVLAANQDQPGPIAVDDAWVYFADYGDDAGHGSIRRVSKSGGAVTILAAGEFVPGNLVVDGARVYWTSNDGQRPSSGAIRAVAKSGGRPVSLASGLSSARALVADSYTLYFATDDAVVALSKSGGLLVPLSAARCVNTAAQDSTTVYWTENCVITPPQGVFAVSKLGGVAVQISNDSTGGIMADGAYVYWIAGGLVKAQPRFGGLPITLYDTGNYGVLEAIDATSLYLQLNDGVTSVKKAGGQATTLWTGFGVNAIAADSGSVYFDGGPTGSVYRLRR